MVENKSLEVKKEVSCGGVVYRKRDVYEFLIIKHLEGHYAFPKGHMEKGETHKETAIREIKEETGIDVELDKDFVEKTTYSTKKNVLKTVYFFLAKEIGGKLKPQEKEIESIEWLEFEDAYELVTHNRDKGILRSANDYLIEME